LVIGQVHPKQPTPQTPEETAKTQAETQNTNVKTAILTGQLPPPPKPMSVQDRLAAEQAAKGPGQVSSAIQMIGQAYKSLDENAAIPNRNAGFLRNLVAGVESSGLGQTVSRYTDVPDQANRDLINAARSRLLLAMKQATGMGASMLRSNVELNTYLSSLGDTHHDVMTDYALLDRLDQDIGQGNALSRVLPAPLFKQVRAMSSGMAPVSMSQTNTQTGQKRVWGHNGWQAVGGQ
jgi:hypothetical protein